MAGFLILVFGGFGALLLITISLMVKQSPSKSKYQTQQHISKLTTRKKKANGGKVAAYFTLNG